MTSADSVQTMCPFCHTARAQMSTGAGEAPGDWRCVTCGQRWDASRLATVAAYASWALEHDKTVPARPRPWDDLGTDGLEVLAGPDRPSAV